MKFRSFVNRISCCHTSVSQQTIPNQHNRFAQLFQKDIEKIYYQQGVNIGLCVQTEIETDIISGWRHAQSRNCRNFLMRARSLMQNRSFSRRRPTATQQRSHHQSAFVDKYNKCFQSCRFFFMRGHSSLIHRWISPSFRSIATRFGRWGLQPIACNNFPT